MMQERSTWIKLMRRFTAWEWYEDSHMVHLFIHLLLSANHRDASWRGVSVKRGQLITGRKKLSQQTGMSEQTVRTCLERLKVTNEITIQSTSHYSIVTVCKFDTYQENGKPANQPKHQALTDTATSPQPSANQPLTTIKEGKEEKKDKKGERGTRARFVPPVLEEVEAYCRERGNRVDAKKFMNHYTANGWKQGRGKPIVNWQAAVRTWEGNGLDKPMNGHAQETPRPVRFLEEK